MTHTNATVLFIAGVLAPLLCFPIWGISSAIAKNNDLTYNEYLNGYETGTSSSSIVCLRDGACEHTYICDPYWVTVYDGKDSNGNLKYSKELRYHQCPYSQKETTYYVLSTIGSFTIAHNLMTGKPWRFGTSIPGGRVKEAPKSWLEAKKRVDEGKGGPVTKQSTYQNYILSSKTTILKRYSPTIAYYKKKGLLPDPAQIIAMPYTGYKINFVNTSKLIPPALNYKLNNDLNYLNGSVGFQLHGDVHIVMVPASIISNPNTYANTVMTYWQSKAVGKNAISKNAIVIVMGITNSPLLTTDTTQNATQTGLQQSSLYVGWVKAFTGMPIGNEALLTQLESDLQGLPVDDNLIGHPYFNTKTNTVTKTNGAIESILYGPNRFQRVSMSQVDKNGDGDYTYLTDEWTPSTGLIILISFISAIFVFGLYCLGIYLAYTKYADSFDPISTLFIKKESKK